MEIQSNKRVPRTVPVFIFAANLHDRSVRDSCDPEEGQAWLPRILSKVRVLRDTGASRNFISQAVVSRLDLPVMTGASPLRVRLADGSVKMSAQVVDLKVHFPSYTYEGLFQVLEMGTSDVDLIWGTPWEASLGDVTSNYDTGVLSFVHTPNKSAQKVILRSELHQGQADQLNLIDDMQAMRDVNANRRQCGSPKGCLTYIHMGNNTPVEPPTPGA